MTRTEHLLVCLAEECNEVAQRVAKALRFGLEEVQPGQELNNAERIVEELRDLVAVAFMLERDMKQPDLFGEGHFAHFEEKEARVEEHLRYGEGWKAAHGGGGN